MYRYETHLHTALGSKCSDLLPQAAVERYARLGYAGIFVTDHFLNGNTTVPKELAWVERVARYCEGFRAVRDCAQGSGLDVLFGLEYSYKGTDFLVYGLGGEWLTAHPEIMEMTVREFCGFARAEGGLVVQAHPYREACYIDHIRLFPSDVDGLEVINAGRDARCNRLADVLADEYGLRKTAGSDLHHGTQSALAGMEFESRLRSETDFTERIKRGEGRLFTLSDGGNI